MAPIQYTIAEIITDAFIEIGACPPGEQPSADESQWGLRKANLLFDEWQALERYVWGRTFDLYTVPPNVAPVTIGPSGSATLAITGPRPVRVESAAQILNSGSSAVDLPINIRDRAWWAANQTKGIGTNVITDLFYDPTFGPTLEDGALYFWPVLSASAQVRLQLWQTVTQFQAITDPIGGPTGPGTLPPAYRSALLLTLAESLLSGSRRAKHPDLGERAKMARAAVFSNTGKSPRIGTQDSGMPKKRNGGMRGDFNWFTGGAAGGGPE